jgi:hypothetical protein
MKCEKEIILIVGFRMIHHRHHRHHEVREVHEALVSLEDKKTKDSNSESHTAMN